MVRPGISIGGGCSSIPAGEKAIAPSPPLDVSCPSFVDPQQTSESDASAHHGIESTPRTCADNITAPSELLWHTLAESQTRFLARGGSQVSLCKRRPLS